MKVRSLVLSLALVPCVAVVANAQPQPRPVPSVDAKQKASEHFERGRSAYNFGNYDVAIREYQAAFDLTGSPELMFNIAQTYRTKGDKKLALDFYKKYIELDPTGDGVVSARSHMEGIERELHAEEVAAELRRKADAEAALRRQAETEAARLAAAETAWREAEEAAKRRVGDAEAGRRRITSRYLRIAGLAAGGAGVVTLGVSSYFGMRARSLSREASDTTGMWTEEAQRTVDRANSSERTMFILLGVGGAVAITGTVLYLVGTRTNESAPVDPKRITVTPGPIPGGAAVFVGGSF